MDRPKTPAEGPVDWTLPTWAWLLGVFALCAWQGWLTLALFGDYPYDNLLDDKPIMSGVHPQHLYLARRGAEGVITHGRTTVVDHWFQALYPKTPIFDGGRLAELFLLLGGGSYQPAAYKIGFAVICFLVPIFFLVTAKSIGLGDATSLLATLLGQLIWWGPHGRLALVTGDCALYFASLATLAHIGFLVNYHRTASVYSWFGLWLTASLGWFLQPLFFPIALPVLLIYYLSVGTKHDFLTWHIAFWWAEILAVVVNLPWLIDWADSWWLRAPLPAAAELLEHRTLATVWSAPLWGGATNRLVAIFLVVSATVGILIFNQTQQRPAARMLGLSAGGAIVLAFLGISWEPLGVVGTAALFAPGLWFACIPAVHAWIWFGERLWRLGLAGHAVALGLVCALPATFVLLTDSPHTLVERCLPTEPLEIGLGPKREAIVKSLLQATNADARILWEDRHRSRQASRWPALLPILTERSYIGGLDPDGFIEHSSICLRNQMLENRPIVPQTKTDWTDEQLMDYCRRYNVSWIVAWTPAVIERFERWPAAEKVKALVDDETGWLFAVKRSPTFALKGQADLLNADSQFIMLGNVVPQNGEVILSLHYQAGMRASPGRVQIERATSGDDDIGFVRLRLATTAKFVTLTWER